jgi:hypothetical protein
LFDGLGWLDGWLCGFWWRCWLVSGSVDGLIGGSVGSLLSGLTGCLVRGSVGLWDNGSLIFVDGLVDLLLDVP